MKNERAVVVGEISLAARLQLSIIQRHLFDLADRVSLENERVAQIARYAARVLNLAR